MGIIESIIKALSENHNQMGNVQMSKLEEMVKVFSGVFLISSKDKKKQQKREDSEAFLANTLATLTAGLYISSDMDAEEQKLTAECCALRDTLNREDLSKEQKAVILEQLKYKYSELLDVREKYDGSTEMTNDVTRKANSIIKRCATQFYTDDISSRFEKNIDMRTSWCNR